MKRSLNSQKGSESVSKDYNLLICLICLLAVAAVTATFTAWLCNHVLASFEDSHAMVMLLTDSGVKSDDKTLERNLSTATQGLMACRDIGYALGVGCIGVGTALLYRVRKQG